MKVGSNHMVSAGPCRRNEGHSPTRVSSTQGRIRYCVCDECGERWQMIGPEANATIEFLQNAAERFRDAKFTKQNGIELVVFPRSEVLAFADQCEFHGSLKPVEEKGRRAKVTMSAVSLNHKVDESTLAALKGQENEQR